MSGGDLDGDVYMVIWDDPKELDDSKKLVSKVKPEMIHPPAVYKKYIPSADSLPKQDEIVEHIGHYFKEDRLGTLSNLHLAMCVELGKDGPKDPDMEKLSHLISIAVDFAKHGECISQNDYAPIKDKLKAWPDFLEKNDD